MIYVWDDSWNWDDKFDMSSAWDMKEVGIDMAW